MPKAECRQQYEDHTACYGHLDVLEPFEDVTLLLPSGHAAGIITSSVELVVATRWESTS